MEVWFSASSKSESTENQRCILLRHLFSIVELIVYICRQVYFNFDFNLLPAEREEKNSLLPRRKVNQPSRWANLMKSLWEEANIWQQR